MKFKDFSSVGTFGFKLHSGSTEDFSYSRISSKEIKAGIYGSSEDSQGGKKPKDKKKDYSQERKNKRGE
jgi:hypothetical protein